MEHLPSSYAHPRRNDMEMEECVALPATVAWHSEAVNRVIQTMRSHLGEPFSLRKMAEIAIVSRYHFNRMFRHLTGIPPCQFLWALRLEAAKRRLLTTQDSVTEICYDIGYNSLGTFIRRFTALLGTSPGRFRSMGQTSTDYVTNLLSLSAKVTEAQSRGAIAGEVSAPEGFSGLIFIGLFTDPIPQGVPVACTILSQPGAYRLANAPEGLFHLFAAGLPWAADPQTYFLYESALRGGGQQIQIAVGEVIGSTSISLRPPEPLDPPILLTLPFLSARQTHAEHESGALR